MISTHKALYLFGLSCLFAASVSAQQVIKVVEGSTAKEVLLLPLSYTIDNSLKDIDAIKTGHLPPKKDGSFKVQLEKIAVKVSAQGGNVFQITRIEDHKQTNRYRFWGEVYHANDLGALKEKINSTYKRMPDGSHYASLIIYRPAYSAGFSDDSIKYDLIINDTLKMEMQANTICIFKVAKDGPVKITVSHRNFVQNMTIDVKSGNSYYVKNYVNIPHTGKYINTGEFKVRLHGYTPYLEKVDDPLQGAIESSMITQVIISKKI